MVFVKIFTNTIGLSENLFSVYYSCRVFTVSKIPLDLNNIPRKPKLPKSAQEIYIERRLEELKNDDPLIKKSDLKKQFEEEWKILKEKDSYKELASKEMQEYKEKKKAYNDVIGMTITVGQAITLINEYQKLNKQKLKSKPKKPFSAYQIFIKSFIEKKSSSIKDGSKEWKRLSDVEKKPFIEEAKRLKYDYVDALEKWKNKDNN